MFKQIMILPLTLMTLNLSFHEKAIASEVTIPSGGIDSNKTGSILSTISEENILNNKKVINEYNIPEYNPEHKNKKPALNLNLSGSDLQECFPELEVRPGTITSVSETDKSLKKVISKSDVSQETKIDESKVSESKISECQMVPHNQFEPITGATLKFNANVFLEFYLRRIVTKSLMKGEVKYGLDNLANKLETVIGKAQNNSRFLLKCFSSKKAQRFQENIQTLRDLLTSSYSCCCLFTQSVPTTVHNAEVLANLDKSANQVLKNFDKLTSQIQKRMEQRNQKATNSINVIAESFIEKANKLKGTVIGLQNVCDPKIDKIRLIETIMDSISRDIGEEELSVEI